MESQTDQDLRLVSACLKNEPRAWDIFVDRFSRLIYWSIRKTLAGTAFAGRDEIAAEVFQEFFRRLLEGGSLAGLREITSVRKYLSITACHLTLDRVKSVSRHENKFVYTDDAVPGADEGKMLLFQAPSPEVLSSEERRLIEAALSSLTLKERSCVEYHFVEGMTHGQIASVLGLSVDSVSTVIRRTREKLKKDLTEKGF